MKTKNIKQSVLNLISQRHDIELPAFLGDRSGNIKADNNSSVYVMLFTGEVIIVQNHRVPNVPRLPVVIGYDISNKTLLQVLRSRDVFERPIYPDVPEHAKLNHEWPNIDTLWVRGEQFIPGLAVPVSGLTVQVFGFVYYLAGWKVLPTQEIDLTPSLPTDGALFVLVEVDASGVVSLRNGDPAASREVLTYADIPLPVSDQKPLFAVKMYVGQSSIIKGRLETDIIDLRFAGNASGGIASTVNWADIYGTPASFPPDTTITDPLYPRIYTALVPPSTGDDSGDGYKIGDVWVDTIGLIAYQAVDVSVGAAVWFAGASSSGGSGDLNFKIDGALAVATGVYTFLVTKDMTIDYWYIHCDDKGAASSTIFDVHKNGTTIFTTQANRPTLAYNDADGWAKSGTPDTTTFVEGDIITIDIDQVATGAEGLNGVGQVSASSGGSANPTFKDESSIVSITNVGEVIVPDGMLVDNGGKSVSLLIPEAVVLQVVTTVYSTKSTHTTQIPVDDTIPQNTEGEEIFTVSITPKSATSDLLIDVLVHCSNDGTSNVTLALFQGSVADALSAMTRVVPSAGWIDGSKLKHKMTAGTTSAITFKVRIGPNTGTTTVNGSLGNRYFGGVLKSSITVMEVAG